MQTIVVGITGGIAAYKSAQLVSDLVKKGYDVYVLMSENAKKFIAPQTFETLTKHNVAEMFDERTSYNVEHISLAKKADLFIIAPATANIIGKIAHGIADDMLTTTFMASTCKKIIAPAMNTDMYNNPIVQNNISLLKEYGVKFVEPVVGRLACEDVGTGKLATIPTLIDAIEQELFEDKCLEGKHVLVTAGPTQEVIDPVRYITNHSSGKMGYAIAKMARRCGAKVTLIAGTNNLKDIPEVEHIDVVSAQDMLEAVSVKMTEADVIVKAAAVADYRPQNIANNKIKKGNDSLTLELESTTDILSYVSSNRKATQVLCGFAMETENLVERAQSKLVKKNLDMIVANDLSEEGAGFGVDSNKIVFITKDNAEKWPLMSKEEVGYGLCKKFALELEKRNK